MRRASPAAPAAAEATVVDRRVLTEHVAALGLAGAEGIVDTWRRTTRPTPDELVRAATAGARGDVAEIAHRLKSSSRHVGLVGLSDRAATVERLARKADEAIDAPVADLVAALRASAVALDGVWGEIARAQPAKT